jgi:hypothetical protein
MGRPIFSSTFQKALIVASLPALEAFERKEQIGL